MVPEHECVSPQKSTVIKVRLLRQEMYKGLGEVQPRMKWSCIRVKIPLRGNIAQRNDCPEKRLLVTSVPSFTMSMICHHGSGLSIRFLVIILNIALLVKASSGVKNGTKMSKVDLCFSSNKLAKWYLLHFFSWFNHNMIHIWHRNLLMTSVQNIWPKLEQL